jgi:hypothetical protein
VLGSCLRLALLADAVDHHIEDDEEKDNQHCPLSQQRLARLPCASASSGTYSVLSQWTRILWSFTPYGVQVTSVRRCDALLIVKSF